VLAIYAVKDIDQAIALANDAKYGLGATIVSKDEQKAIATARRIESGMVFVNHLTTSMAELPFGGVKNSGYGRELSTEGILEFVNHKLIRISTPQAAY
ncbi:MAG: aldehyde dehydrogenase family protein, partial [Rikenellaceae bacterium]|nr:aldehyde dehydrogenase family protein [Rikenellaceae bacterium]